MVGEGLALQKNLFYHLFRISANMETCDIVRSVPWLSWDAQATKISLTHSSPSASLTWTVDLFIQ